jgi:hypothetical protein
LYEDRPLTFPEKHETTDPTTGTETERKNDAAEATSWSLVRPHRQTSTAPSTCAPMLAASAAESSGGVSMTTTS